MKRTLLYLIIVVMLFIPGFAFADVIHLKSGAKIEGIIEKETDQAVTISIKIGTLTYPKEQIESISRATDEENVRLKEKWKSERQQEKAEQEKRIQAITEKEEVKPTKPKTEEKKVVTEEKPKKEAVKEKPIDLTGIISFYDRFSYRYAYRLPPSYNTQKKYPVLFCFDPGGNGEDAARRFAYATDKLGWIVVGSLDTRNGPWPPIIRAQEAMLKDIPKRFSVAEKRFYATGLSGGARAAAAIAYKHPTQFRGIITCAMGVPDDPERYKITKNVAVYICIGKRDFNLEAAQEEYGKLRGMGAEVYKNEFEGGHEWPSEGIIKDALDWIAKH